MIIRKRYSLDRVPKALESCHYRWIARRGLGASIIRRLTDCVIWELTVK